MDGTDPGGGSQFHREITVGDRVQRICCRSVEAKSRGRAVPINRVGRTGQCRSTQRAFIQTLTAIG